MRTPLLFVSLCAALLGHARSFQQYVATFSSAPDAGQEKQLIEILHGLDQEAACAFQGNVMAIGVRATMTQDLFAALIAPTGLELIALTGDLPGTERSVQEPRLRVPDFPVRLDTGDQWSDDARYEADKSLWISTHPGLYEMMTAPAGSEETH